MTASPDTASTDTTTAALTGTWEIDPSHSSFGFSARHAMVSTVRGSFGSFTGTLVLDGADPARSSAQAVVDATSVTTGTDQRDEHLRNADFFAVAEYPQITFTSTSVTGTVEASNLKLTGDLTIKGVSNPVTLDVEFQGLANDPFGNLRAGFEGTTTINRKDWGISWNAALETGGFLVSEKVKLLLDISAIKHA